MEEISNGYYSNPQVEQLLIRLSKRLANTTGKKVYGYLKADVKAIVDEIVAELSKDENIRKLYDLWYEQREDVLRTYTDHLPERVPLEQNKEFKSIRNAVIQEALRLNGWVRPIPVLKTTFEPPEAPVPEEKVITEEEFPEDKPPENPPEELEMEEPSNKENRPLHHCGYRNFRLVLAAAKAHCPNPERILIAGVSAGALAVAALAEDIIQEFPQCSAISCCVDGGLTYTNWNRIAMDVWNAPTSITEKMTGPDMVLDCLIALNRKYGKQVQCLYISSTRDAVLAWFQKALDGEVPEYTADAGIRYQKNLTNTCLKLIEEVPEAGVYIYANPCRDVDLDPALGLTQHTILAAENIIESGENRPSVMQWLWDCVHGRTSKVGLELLG